jgi:hypothetical protein
VIPTEVHVWESSAAGFVTQVEAWVADTHEWVTLWQGIDPTPPGLGAFSPPLGNLGSATQRIRVTIDTAVQGWNEIDAVELVGVAAS